MVEAGAASYSEKVRTAFEAKLRSVCALVQAAQHRSIEDRLQLVQDHAASELARLSSSLAAAVEAEQAARQQRRKLLTNVAEKLGTPAVHACARSAHFEGHDCSMNSLCGRQAAVSTLLFSLLQLLYDLFAMLSSIIPSSCRRGAAGC